MSDEDLETPGDAGVERHGLAAHLRRGIEVPRWLIGVLALMLACGASFGVGRVLAPDASEPNAAPRVTPSAPTTPAGPDTLAGLVVHQHDVAGTLTVRLIPGGDRFEGQITLDLCNGTFPSEARRTARLQVAVVDSQGNAPLSTEAVTYGTPADGDQAFAELRATAASCPSTPVVSPVGEPTVTTKFNAAPDGAWPKVPTVERLAFDFVTTAAGQSQHGVAVYLRRGRVLMGVYFSDPDDSVPTVDGQRAIANIVNVFATRIAALPVSVTGS